MRASSTDLREQIVRSVQADCSQRERAWVFGIGESIGQALSPTAASARHLGSQASSLCGSVTAGQSRRARFRAQLKTHPEATLEQRCALVADQGERLSVAAMLRKLASAPLATYKKSLTASKHEEIPRAV